MQLLKGIKEKIGSVIGKGEILIIVPPFGNVKCPTLGPHILQSFARKIGYNTDILYLNNLLSSIIGVDLYDSIAQAPLFWMLGERLFARRAYGLPPLGKTPEFCPDEAISISGSKKQHIKMYYKTKTFNLETYKKIEVICKSFMDEVIPVIASMDYKIVGCSITWEQTNCSIALLNGIKNMCPGTITLVGGTKCEGEMAEGIASLSDSIDYVFSGESELSFINFLKDYTTGDLPSQRVISSKPLRNLDEIPLPDYHCFFKQMTCFFGDNFPYKRVIRYETSRGCWRGRKKKCTFCYRPDVAVRQKSVKKVLKELGIITIYYPGTAIAMCDDNIPSSYHDKLIPSISKKKEFPLISYFIGTHLELQELINLKKARIEAITAGIETLSTELLKIMNKGVTAKQNLLFLRNTRALGIHTTWVLLWGFPYDKVEYYEKTLKILPLIRHFQPPAALVHLMIYRSSSYFENQKQYNIRNLRPWAAYNLIYPDWADVHKLACSFIGDYPCEAHQNPEIIREIANEVSLWRKKWNHSTLFMKYFMGAYVIYDNRDFHAKTKMHYLDYQQARSIMTSHVYQESEIVKWAVEEKLGVIVDSWYVPLVTTSPELLLEFEEEVTNFGKGKICRN
jgi:ribosomal peptide maturation radical SAM protein 1